ncbi:hypothetical protein NF865_02645 [Thermococcus aggregans]|uniref:Tetratricopeptide repeat protein n=1 Tax=Thermococcus aggregans TaxID=110163 RepID=A0A9E7SP91_THEAG|nr:hypothetical protein [Thermococcus aggregans]USS41126.1 hypothetical protein NF865_02645 [Thermococcus aggregans]
MEGVLLQIRKLLAHKRIEEAYALAEQIPDSYWRGYALKWVAESVVVKNPKRAIKIAKKIEIETLKSETLLLLSYELAKLRKFKEAVEAAKLINNNYLRKKAFRGISNALARAIIESSAKEVRLSEFNLGEEDIQYLMPLPGNIKYKDGKFLTDAEIHRITGKAKIQVLTSENPTKRRRVVVGEKEDKEDQDLKGVSTCIERLILTNQLQEAEKLAKGVDDPCASYLLEEIGITYINQGNIEKAEEILEKLGRADYLASELVKFYLKRNEVEKAKKYALRIFNPALKLSAAYSILLIGGIDEKFLSELFKDTSPYKLGRLLKFLAFELLEEAKERNSSDLLRLSKNIFLLGKREHQKIH